MKIRQIQIENDEIRRVECCGPKPFRGVLGLKYREAMKLETGAKKPPYFRFVINQRTTLVDLFIGQSRGPGPRSGQGNGGRGPQSLPAARNVDGAAVRLDEGRRDPKSQTGSGDSGLMAMAAE
jgi:hypothetical protein